MAELGLMIVENWKPAKGKTALQSLCDDFNIAAEMVDDEYGVFSRFNDLADRTEYVFLATVEDCKALAQKHTGRMSGPHRPVIALTGG